MNKPQKMTVQPGIGDLATNAYGDRYFYNINRDAFAQTGAEMVFTAAYKPRLFEKNTFYIVSGTDSGLLVDFVARQEISDNTKYLFVELPEVMQALKGRLTNLPKGMRLCSINDWEKTAQAFSVMTYATDDKVRLVESQAVSNIFYAEYAQFKQRLRQEVYQFRWQTKVAFSYNMHRVNQIKNLTENQYPASVLKNSFPGKTAVLLAAGPSLTDHLDWVRHHRADILLASVSRNCSLLLEHGITPDMIGSVDTHLYNFHVSRDIHEFASEAVLVNGNSLTPEVLSAWRGRKVYMDELFPWETNANPKNVDTYGPTVTNSLYSLLVHMGFKNIILLGADFCFSQDGKTHALPRNEMQDAISLRGFNYSVNTYAGNIAETTNEYLFSARELDAAAKKAVARGCTTYNPSTSSMKLDHVICTPLDTITLAKMAQSPRSLLSNRIPIPKGYDLIRHYRDVILTEVRAMMDQVRSIKVLILEAMTCNEMIIDYRDNSIDPAQQRKMDGIERLKQEKYPACDKFLKTYGIKEFLQVPVYDKEVHGPFMIRDIGRKYYTAYLKTIDEVDLLIRQSVFRASNRVIEEQKQPKVDILLRQWVSDKQYARAAKWIDEHPEIYASLSEKDRVSMTAMQQRRLEYQRDIEEKFHGEKVTGIILERTHERIRRRAKEYFDDNNSAGISMLVNSIASGRQNQNSGPLRELLHGYMSEMNGNIPEAKDIYALLTTGPYKKDALDRLLTLALASKDYTGAVPVLAQLSAISSNYLPALADVLHNIGESTKAIDLYADYLLLHPDDLQSMYKLGSIYQQLGYREGVEFAANYILQKDPGSKAARLLLQS